MSPARLRLLHAAPAPLAALLWLGSVLGFGALLPGYSQMIYPTAALGALGIPRAQLFNLLGYALPGALIGLGALSLRLRLPLKAPWPQRIGAQLMFLSALGFVAMGLFRLDPQQLDGRSTRLHATAWVLWWASALAGTLLLGLGLRGQVAWQRLARDGLVLGLAMTVLALIGPMLMPDGLSQRLSILAWMAWAGMAGLGGPAGQGSGLSR